mmetsp:Transcript_47900/g.96631  ORF Transcript_47900/g.96631 Transcript_47900/m.96631 type:complete len:349 (-) Transcript_47900:150-1196(-)
MGVPPRALMAPRFIRMFDWRLNVTSNSHLPDLLDDRENDDPSTVLSSVHAAMEVILAARNWRATGRKRVLVLHSKSGLTWAAMGETEEVRVAVVNELLRLFDRLYTTGNDVPGSFRTTPLALTEHKVRRTGADTAMAAIASARLDDQAKPFLLLAPSAPLTGRTDYFGGPLWNWNVLSETNSTRAILKWGRHPFYSVIPMWKTSRAAQSGQVPKVVSRQMADKWADSPEAVHIGVVTKSFKPRAWWAELSKFRFMLSPMGDEIQCPKTVEALLVLTIPILQRGPYPVPDDLLRLGFPIVVVDEWEEVTSAKLDHWWQALSPRLLSFRANCLTTDAWWRIVTGENESCH